MVSVTRLVNSYAGYRIHIKIISFQVETLFPEIILDRHLRQPRHKRFLCSSRFLPEPDRYTLHAIYVVGEFGGQVQFGCIAGLATQYNQITFGAGGGRHEPL